MNSIELEEIITLHKRLRKEESDLQVINFTISYRKIS